MSIPPEPRRPNFSNGADREKFPSTETPPSSDGLVVDSMTRGGLFPGETSRRGGETIGVKRVAILGASGSIGSAALEVVAASEGKLRAALLSVHQNTRRLVEEASRFKPETVIIVSENADRAPLADLPSGIEVLFGETALEKAIRRETFDVVLSAIVGSAGLRGTMAALESKQTVALANKESLVMAGPLLLETARRVNRPIFPVDSEHSAIYQSLAARNLSGGLASGQPLSVDSPKAGGKVRRLILTASGGPFRNKTKAELENVTVEEALAHPTWRMGKKITVDSATMMNKALEIIEARWLFDMEPDQIEVMIHPQSVIHSMVEFTDGAVAAQMSPPDMKLPIQLALNGMERLPGPAAKFDWSKPLALELFPPDEDRFPAIRLGKQAARDGGSSGAVLNAANETAVAAFLAGKISFPKITAACEAILNCHQFEERPSLSRLFQLDAWARRETEKWISD